MSDEQDLEQAELEQPIELPPPAIKSRPENCAAIAAGDRKVCDRCGLSWPALADGPACAPITFAELADEALTVAIEAEGSLALVRGLQSRGMPTDGGARAERRLAMRKKISTLVDLITADPQLRALANAKIGGRK